MQALRLLRKSTMLTMAFVALIFYRSHGANITAAEYFFDVDPGFGMGTSIAAADGAFNSSVENVSVSFPTLSLSIGVHTLYLRMKNDNNEWGTARKIMFFVNGNQFVAEQEYFIDADPGPGNGTPLTAADGNFNGRREVGTAVINTSSLAIGIHRLFVRAKNGEGHWGTPREYSFEIINGTTLSAMEFFVDADPGFGNGTPLASLDGAFYGLRHDAIGTLITTGLSYGAHTVSVRGRNSFSNWGVVQNVNIAIESPLITLVSPLANQYVTSEDIIFNWNYVDIADSFDLIIDDAQNLSSPEVSKKHISGLNGYSSSTYSLNGARGWLSAGTWHWKVIAYRNGTTYHSAMGVFTYNPNTQAAPVWGPLLRAYNPVDKDHFYCTQARQQLAALPQDFIAEKPQGFISVLPCTDADIVPVYRLYNGSLYPGWGNYTERSHLYTISGTEKNDSITRGWLYEGIIGFAYRTLRPGLVPLYHLCLSRNSPRVLDHFYSIDELERSNARSRYGFQDAGILAYVAPVGNNSTLPYSMNGPTIGFGVDPFNGNFSYQEKNSFSMPEGRMSLDFGIQYSSLAVLLKTPVRCLSYGWSHTYSACLTVSGGLIRVYWPGGGYHEYAQTNCARKTIGIYDSLTRLSDTLFEIKTRDQTVYRFAMLKRADSLAVLSSIRDRNNNAIQCTYELKGNLATVTGPKNRKLKFSYDSIYLKSVMDTLGRMVEFGYREGNLSSYRNANGDVTYYRQNSGWPFEHILDTIEMPDGNRIINQYDTSMSANSTRRVISQQKGPNWFNNPSVVQLDYTNSSFVRAIDSRGYKYDFSYKPQKEGIINNLVTPAGQARYEYGDQVNNPLLPTVIFDGMGYITNVSYDTRGNVRQVDKPYSSRYVFHYTTRNDLSMAVGPLGDTTIYTYDTRGNLDSINTYRGSTRMFYRTDGLVDSVIDPLGNRTAFIYNTFGNVKNIYDPLDHSTEYTYDVASRMTSVKNPRGFTSYTSYTPTDLVNFAVGPINDSTSYGYDRSGKVKWIRNAKRDSTILTYNSRQLLESIRNPLNKVTSFSYTNDFLTKKTLPSGDTIGITYDTAGRVRANSGAVSALYEYDANDNVVKVVDGTNQMTYSYDSLNRLIRYVNYDRDTVGYIWDKAGNLKTIVYPGGRNVTYTYYRDNLLYQVIDWLRDTTSYYYKKDGSLDYMRYPNGVRCLYTYDKAGNVKTLANVKTNGDTICAYAFILDEVGNITGESRNEPVTPGRLYPEITTYDYDAGNRIRQGGTLTYTHDENGNMKGYSRIGTNVVYDFDPINRLKNIDTNNVSRVSYAYDVNGNRISASRNGSTVNYVLDISGQMSNVLMEKRPGMDTVYYIHGLGMIYRILSDSTPEYYQYDLRGSTIAITDTFQTITHKYAYGPYGEIVADSGMRNNVYKFVGKYGVTDEENGIYCMRARYYDAKIGRFLSEDPVWGANLYEYAGGNPVLSIDPSGLIGEIANSTPMMTNTSNVLSEALVIWGSTIYNEIKQPFSEGRYISGTIGIPTNFMKGSLYAPWVAATQGGLITLEEAQSAKKIAVDGSVFFCSAWQGGTKIGTDFSALVKNSSGNMNLWPMVKNVYDIQKGIFKTGMNLAKGIGVFTKKNKK